MARWRNANAPTAHDEQVRAVVGALAPASLDLTKLRARAANSEEVRPVRASKRDVLAAFGAGSRLGQLIYRARWNRERSRHLIETAALLLVHELTKRRKARTSVTMRILALTAIAEYVEGDCPKCNGTGRHGGRQEQWLWSQCPSCRGKGRSRDGVECTPTETRIGCNGVGKIRRPAPEGLQLLTCGTCKGTGKVAVGENRRAANLGVDVEAFRKGWASRYSRALAILARAERETATAIDLRLGKPQHRVRVSEESYALSDESDMLGEHEQDPKASPASSP